MRPWRELNCANAVDALCDGLEDSGGLARELKQEGDAGTRAEAAPLDCIGVEGVGALDRASFAAILDIDDLLCAGVSAAAGESVGDGVRVTAVPPVGAAVPPLLLSIPRRRWSRGVPSTASARASA